ncbi:MULTISPECIES: hypothetical protein [Haloprofundus]|uniref:hypothetical protein n=1 Tax=Haloprofundus TaxID=1911573 RepID=UPI000E43FC00|nr:MULTISPECIES: hypothetical protein [Haloprofundus]QCJ48082.1 hypothetical protein FCF25_13550 [Haloprofundus sp. MHR1]
MNDEHALVEQHDIDSEDQLDREILHLVRRLRREGYTLRELVPRLRRKADYYAEFAEEYDKWDYTPSESGRAAVDDE